MIEKIGTVQGFGVFDAYNWDSHVRDADGPILFKKLNIIYGRNYSGKTTLSRIVRSLETGVIDPKFGTPCFTVQVAGGTTVSESSLQSHELKIRVFNEDFVRENLRFIVDPDHDIEPFAILGKDNNELEEEIGRLEAELGSNEPGQETGLYGNLKAAEADLRIAVTSHTRANQQLEGQLSSKATGNPAGIKYQSELFGDQNYNIAKLRRDITEVQKATFSPIDANHDLELRKLVGEQLRPQIPSLVCPDVDFEKLSTLVAEIASRKISQSSKIEELLNDAMLNRWVSEGRKVHENDRCNCKFCGNRISEERWAAIESHFDAESDRLERDIHDVESAIESARQSLEKRKSFDSSVFYSQFQHSVAALELQAGEVLRLCKEVLESLSATLTDRKLDLLKTVEMPPQCDAFAQLQDCYRKFGQLCKEANGLSNNLSTQQTQAKEVLRRNEVYRFLSEITYVEQQKRLMDLEVEWNRTRQAVAEINQKISVKKEGIIGLQRQLHDEEQGAIRVNQLLNSFFGNRYLSLQAFEKNDETGAKKVRFQVVREGQRAYHLSEGECSLLAFCYFMAKLEEVGTSDTKPIVWIDDPISSLDGNHIFFVYSLINQRLKVDDHCVQLFISTHSLEFLKYLRRHPNVDREPTRVGERKKKCRFLQVERVGKKSSLKPLPMYMQEYVTEFNYLFHQIYKCASIEVITDDNWPLLYSFGNNARKFLEIYLYYLYPDYEKDDVKINNFFGNDGTPAVLVDRVNNEYSHLAGVLERGSSVIDQPEMISCANAILCRLKQTPHQYASLLRSVGEEAAAEAFLASLTRVSTSGEDVT